MLRTLFRCLLAVVFCAPGAQAAVLASSTPRLLEAIPPQTLTAALNAFKAQTGVQYFSDVDMTELRSKGTRAGFNPEDALKNLLEGTGLRFEVLNERTVKIYDPRPIAHEPLPAAAPPLEQIIITARRRVEEANKVPIDAFVWTEAAMEASGIKSVADVGALTPGVEFDFFSSVGSGIYTNMVIRGVTDRHGTATGLFIDDIPVSPLRSNTFGRALPFNFDLDRIEVVRGPQGTLMGANTQGGAIRFVPKQPDLETFTGVARAEWAATARGDPSYEAGAAAGGPLLPGTLGYRISGWYRSEGGYIDRVDPFTNSIVDANSNSTIAKSVRGALTFAPTEDVRITPALNYESVAGHDSPSFFTYLSDPSAGRLANGSLIRQPFEDSIYLATLKTTWRLDASVELATVTAYFDRTGSLTVDDTESIKWTTPCLTCKPLGWGNPLGPAFPHDYSQTVTTQVGLTQNLFSQEVRLNSIDPSAPFIWLAAVAYSGERYREADRVTGPFIQTFFWEGPLDSSDTTTTVQHAIAAFSQVEINLARFTLTAGVRLERDDYDSVDTSGFRGRAHERLVVPKFALSYGANEHDLYYFSVAKGYAPRGVDAALPTCFSGPTSYPADSVWGYEFGTKHQLWEGRAHLDGSVFHIRWDNGPVTTGNCLFTHLPGTAVSNGFDFAAQARLGERVTAAIALSYTDARYTETVQANGFPIVHDGDAVGTPPLVTSPWNLRVSLEQRWVLRNGIIGSLRAEDIFRSRNHGPFYTNVPGSDYYAPGLTADPSINVLNLRAVMELPNIDFVMFVNNALDAQPTLLKRNKGDDTSTLFYATTLRPRTVGLSATRHF